MNSAEMLDVLHNVAFIEIVNFYDSGFMKMCGGNIL